MRRRRTTSSVMAFPEKGESVRSRTNIFTFGSGTVKYQPKSDVSKGAMATRDTPSTHLTAESAVEQHEHHVRLLEGMAKALATKGYADTTIADIVREAAVSRRSFYEHFATKADCLLALYESASEQALVVLI